MFVCGSLPLSGASIQLQLASLNGTIDPITYTDTDGTFTTSVLTVSLDLSSPSFFTLDTSTGSVSDHTVMDISFNNGKSGGLNADLSGIFTVDESGTLTPAAPPIDFTADMTIDNAILTGAGEFAGAKAKGKNPTFIDLAIVWRFGKAQTGSDDILLDLPPAFAGGTNIPITGEIVATVVPEPSRLTALVGLLALAGCYLQRRVRVF
jgi:hypothetical protein